MRKNAVREIENKERDVGVRGKTESRRKTEMCTDKEKYVLYFYT